MDSSFRNKLERSGLLIMLAMAFAIQAVLVTISTDNASVVEVARPVVTTIATTTTTVPPTTTTTLPPRVTIPKASRNQSHLRGDIYDRLAICESGKNPRAISKSGKYKGAFQFSDETWANVKSPSDPVDPRDATYERQREIVIAKFPISSWSSQFPTCARKLGVA